MASANNTPSTPANRIVPQSQKRLAPTMDAAARTKAVTYTFGHLFEGMSASQDTPPSNLLLLQKQYRKRLFLARLDKMPEGFKFRNRVDKGPEHTFPLLSPPDMIAVRRANGIWHRRIRHASDDPQPYSDAFYQEYLRHYDLPLWFFRAGHFGMLYDNAEARMLGIEVPTPLPDARPDYLEEQFPLAVLQPRMVPDMPNGFLIAGLSQADTYHLARRYPATNVEFVYDLYVTASGHIMLRSRKNDADQNIALEYLDHYLKPDDSRLIWDYEDPNNIKASYRLEVHNRTAEPSAEARARARQGLAAFHAQDGSLVNPEVIPAGLGRWAWFDVTVDQYTAESQNYGQDFVAITEARGSGSLPSEPDSTDFPSVVWIPDKDFLNLDVQPKGVGRWEYLTSGGDYTDDIRAAELFGGRYRLPDQPSALQIFRLRRRFPGRDVEIAAQRPKALDEISIVWIPGTPDPTTATDADSDANPDDTEDTEDARSTPEFRVHSYLERGLTQADRDPTNGEPGTDHDQTNPDRTRRRYYTSRIGGRIITLDRSPIVLGLKQLWKTWTYTDKGWTQYQYFADIDWDDKRSMKRLAKWRAQATRRTGWELLRKERLAYPPEQKQFVRDLVQQAVDAGLPTNNAELYHEFKKAFGDGRGEPGIAALALRLRRDMEGSKAVDVHEELEEDVVDEDEGKEERLANEDDVQMEDDEMQVDEDEMWQDVNEGYQVGQVDLGDYDDDDMFSVHSVQLLEGVPMSDDEDSLFV